MCFFKSHPIHNRGVSMAGVATGGPCRRCGKLIDYTGPYEPD